MVEKETYWTYEKLKDDGTVETIWENKNDFDGSITGKVVFGVLPWLDENPEEARRLGWVKHIHHNTKNIEYNKQTQYLQLRHRIIDAYTYEDEYIVREKTEAMMRRAEEDGVWGTEDDAIVTFGR